MTLVIVAHVPTAIVISGDSRATMTTPVAPGSNIQTHVALSDSTEKVFVLYDKYAAATSGDGIVNNLPIAHYVEEFQKSHASPGTVAQLANELLTYFRNLNPIPACLFYVGGYDGPVPWVMSINVGANTSNRVNVDANGNPAYGMQWMGDIDIVNRILSQPAFQPPYNLLNQQDATDLTRHLIRSTIDQMRFEPRYPTVGGPIDTVIVTHKGVNFLVKKQLHGR